MYGRQAADCTGQVRPRQPRHFQECETSAPAATGGDSECLAKSSLYGGPSAGVGVAGFTEVARSAASGLGGGACRLSCSTDSSRGSGSPGSRSRPPRRGRPMFRFSVHRPPKRGIRKLGSDQCHNSISRSPISFESPLVCSGSPSSDPPLGKGDARRRNLPTA